jgi:thiamine-phosphate pyrophosphorylase
MSNPTHLSRHLRGLYAITNEKLIPETRFHQTIEQVLQGGASIIQYRDKSDDFDKRKKQATALRTLCNEYHALLLINDDLELAQLVNADGIHLGENDASISAARTLLGEDAIIGVSCYNQLELAIKAENEGASYIAFGAFFASPTKPAARVAKLDLINEAKTRLNIPVCAIGGIDLSNAKQVFDAGADMVAVISSLFSHPQIRSVSRQIADLAHN